MQYVHSTGLSLKDKRETTWVDTTARLNAG